MKRVAVYAGTRNLYHKMAVAARTLSLNARMDRIIFLIEDDAFPEALPGYVETINVSQQRVFSPDGPNYVSHWTWMSLMRIAIPLILTDEDTALYLDVDTLCARDVEGIWERDLTGKYMAAAAEPLKCKMPFTYFNAGVLLMNLKLLRESGKAREMIEYINNVQLMYPDQDTINLLCQGKIAQIGGEWNATSFIPHPLAARIIHYAIDRQYDQRPYFRECEKKKWRDYNAC